MAPFLLWDSIDAGCLYGALRKTVRCESIVSSRPRCVVHQDPENQNETIPSDNRSKSLSNGTPGNGIAGSGVMLMKQTCVFCLMHHLCCASALHALSLFL
mmetsp:Transcript_3654/g.5635  ORF Transcript_3654/g.5635 Transcript_3654/m.5635 type:complete len:100 (-) Transcript_3654:46-345(-)